ncbi:Chromate resistance protein ChrB [Nonomuraea dietziae]|uniref:Chromate resistance protein ChrB n=1 Tax=Nonomuraea dietziae TaxID=65515 RepID=UPI00340CC1FF
MDHHAADLAGPADLAGRWVLLAYRIPREPSAPRIAVWRKLERLGVARLGDGLVTLPADARTREQLDWIAEEILAVGGTATVWLAVPASLAQERAIAEQMQAARRAEYQAVIAEARNAEGAGVGERSRTAARLRADLRRIGRRDFFAPAEREHAHQAVHALTAPEHPRTPAGGHLEHGSPAAQAADTGQATATRSPRGETR